MREKSRSVARNGVPRLSPRRSVSLGAATAILLSSLSGCIKESLGIAYQVDGQIYIQAPCGNQITSLEVRGNSGLVAEFAAPEIASAPQVVALASTTEGLTITGPLVGDLVATFDMPDGTWSSSSFNRTISVKATRQPDCSAGP
jgi:phage tail sheath protein FI